MGDQLADEFVLGGAEQENDVRREHVSVLSQEPAGVVDHLGGEGQLASPEITHFERDRRAGRQRDGRTA